MPKSSKKKKEKAADFQKARLKLGKGKLAPTNSVDTSFKARSIVLPKQSVSIQNDAETPTTKRKLTFDDLLLHLKHHNAGVRKDALKGLRELLENHEDVLQSNLTVLINACARVIGDEDGGVRQALITFLRWLLPFLSTDELVPRAPLLLLFTTSAQTSIFPEIRIDAVRVLDILLSTIPDQVTSGWASPGDSIGHGGRVLEGYLNILGASTLSDSTQRLVSTVSLPPSAKAAVLDGLSRFFQQVVYKDHEPGSSSSAFIPTWFLEHSFMSSNHYQSFVRQLHPNGGTEPTFTWFTDLTKSDLQEELFPPEPSDNVLRSLSDVISDIARLATGDISANDAGNEPRMTNALRRALHPVLLSTFLDFAPNVFSPSAGVSGNELQLLLSVYRITRYLYGYLLRTADFSSESAKCAHDDLEALLRRMAPYFPFGEDKLMALDVKDEQIYQELNLIFSELTALSLARFSEATSCRGQSATAKKNPPGSLLRGTVTDYVARCLRGEIKSVSNPMGLRLTPVAYANLLPTLWTLANEGSEFVLDAILDHATQLPSQSAIKKPATEFVAMLALLHTNRNYEGTVDFVTRSSSRFVGWFVHLAQTVWELGGTNSGLSELIFTFLLRTLQQRSHFHSAEVLKAVSARLVPFFIVQHRSRGEISGPYSKLDAALRRLILRTMSVMCGLEGGDGALKTAIERAVIGSGDVGYWRGLVH